VILAARLIAVRGHVAFHLAPAVRPAAQAIGHDIEGCADACEQEDRAMAS